MLHVNLYDGNFTHTKEEYGFITSTINIQPSKVTWLDKLAEYDGITVFTDAFIDPIHVNSVNSKYKVAWIIEPPELVPSSYENILKLEDKFDLIITYNEDLLARGPKYVTYVMGQSRVSDKDAKFYDKYKLTSMIASHKAMSVGHRYRHEIIQKLQSKHGFDVWGSGYVPFDSKLEPLKDYCFSISVMNAKRNDWITEVLIDNFRTGTVPIFWGCPNVGDHFDAEGIITFDTIEELDDILENLSTDDYLKRRGAIKNNFELAKNFICSDDIIADILLKHFK